jgi:hypothetical protein
MGSWGFFPAERRSVHAFHASPSASLFHIRLKARLLIQKCRLSEKNTTKMSFTRGVSTCPLSQLFEITTYLFLA